MTTEARDQPASHGERAGDAVASDERHRALMASGRLNAIHSLSDTYENILRLVEFRSGCRTAAEHPAVRGAAGADGITVVLAEPGRVHLGIDRRDDLLQFKGHFHGGVISGLADLAAGGAVTSRLPPGRGVVTISLHVNFLAPARGERLVAKGNVVKVGGTVGVASVEVITLAGGQEDLCATATVTFRVVSAD